MCFSSPSLPSPPYYAYCLQTSHHTNNIYLLDLKTQYTPIILKKKIIKYLFKNTLTKKTYNSYLGARVT